MRTVLAVIAAVAVIGISITAGIYMSAGAIGDPTAALDDAEPAATDLADSGTPGTAAVPDVEPTAPDDVPDAAMPGMFDPPTEAELRDLAALAESRGASFEETVAAHGWRRGFGQLVGRIAGGYPESYAGAAIEPDGSIWIAFKEAVPASAEALARQFEQEVLEALDSPRQLELIPNRGFTERELHDRATAAHHAVYGQSPFVGDVTTYADSRTGEIQMTVQSTDGDLDRTAADVRSRLPADLVGSVNLTVVGPEVPLAVDD